MLYLLGPLLWVVAMVAVAEVVRHGRSVLIALVVLAAAFLVSLVVLLPIRSRRVREERTPQ